jgi:Heterokaryon incompatibility protein (HET)
MCWKPFHAWETISCVGNHFMRGTQRLPTRLIDLGSGLDAVPTLCKGSELPPKTEYVSLSHCWGTYDPIKLTSQNIGEMEGAIPTEALSKTFRDAIVTTWELGFRYLWIDSLCIMQDSTDDWRREAALMKNIYQKATINIAATASSDGKGGLFYERDPVLVAPHTVEIAWDGLCKGKYHLFDRDLWKDDVLDAPLGKRGWVLQERLLSPRTIHFGKNQVFWECQESQGCETYPHMIPADMLAVSGVWLNLNMWHNGVRLSGGGSGDPGEFLPSVYALWNRIVQTYSRRAFTHNTDKLIALSGVAAVVSKMNDHKYLAGLWDKTLPRALLWAVNDPMSASRPIAYTAPSWSWASVVGEVACAPNVPLDGYEKTMEEITILNAETLPISTDVFGQIYSGSIRLRGPLMLATVGGNGSFIRLLGYDVITAKVGADVGMFVEGQKLYCLPIYSGAGLCLELNGDLDGRYRRVGWWATDHPLGPAAALALCEKFKIRVASRLGGQIREVEEDLGDDEGIKRWVISIV